MLVSRSVGGTVNVTLSPKEQDAWQTNLEDVHRAIQEQAIQAASPHEPAAGLFHLSTPDSILMCYQILRLPKSMSRESLLRSSLLGAQKGDKRKKSPALFASVGHGAGGTLVADVPFEAAAEKWACFLVITPCSI